MGRGDGRGRESKTFTIHTVNLDILRVSAQMANFSPGKQAENTRVIAFKFQPGLKYELGHAHRFSCSQKKHAKHLPANFSAQF